MGAILFFLYAFGLFKVMAKHLPKAHACADDSQLYFYFKPDSSTCQREAIKEIEECIAAVRIQMISHRRLIKDSKTEFLIIGSCLQLSKVFIESVAVGTAVMKPVECVRNLGAWFDNHMSMDTHVVKVCSEAFGGLYTIT